MKRFSMCLFLVIAACGGDSKTNEPSPKIEVRVPVDAATEPQPGFGSGATPVNDNKVVVANKTEPAPAIEHVIPAKYAECISLGKQMLAKGEHAYARELFEAAAKLDRKASLPHVELARSYIDKNEKALALRAAKKAVKLAPESSQAYNTLGRAELLRHDYDGAELAFRQATELDADNVWAWNNLGLVYITQKNYQEAVNALVEATSRKGVESYMWNNLGTAYEQLDQLDDARDAFDSGAKLGSVAAKASRKRLEGVDTIKVAKRDDAKKDTGFTTREEMPEIVDNPEPSLDDDIVTDEPHHDDVEPVFDDTTEVAEEKKAEPDAEVKVQEKKKPEVEEKKAEVKAEVKDEVKVEEKKAEPEVEEKKAEAPKSGTT